MRWPWVSLRSYELLERNTVRALDFASSRAEKAEADLAAAREAFRNERHAERDDFEARMRAATETIATLREQKATAVATIEHLTAERAHDKEIITVLGADLAEMEDAAVKAVAAAQLEARAPKRSKLTQAIRDNARMPDGTIDRRLVNHFRAEANKQLNKNVKEEDVIASLSQWQTTENANQITADRMADLADKAIV